MNEIQVVFKGKFDGTDVLAGIRNTSEQFAAAMKQGFSKVKSSDMFSGIMSGLKDINVAANKSNEEIKKSAKTLQKEFDVATKKANELSKVVAGTGEKYARAFVSMNAALDGLHLNDFMDVIEGLKGQFAFLEDKPLFAKQISEAKTMNEMIAILYEQIAKINKGAETKIGLPELEAGLVAALREAVKGEEQIIGTEQAHEAILQRNVALQAEQGLLLAKNAGELSNIAAIEKDREQTLKRVGGLVEQLKTLNTKYNSDFLGDSHVEQITAALNEAEPLRTRISNLSTQNLKTEIETANVAQQLVVFKNQALQIANQIGLSYEKELKDVGEIDRLYQMKQRMLQEQVRSMSLIQQAVAWMSSHAITFNIFTAQSSMLSQAEGDMQRVLNIWEKLRASMSENLPVPLANSIDMVRIRLEMLQIAYEKLKAQSSNLLGWDEGSGRRFDNVGGGYSGGGSIPPGGTTPPDSGGWEDFRSSLKNTAIEANALYRQLQEIASMKIVKGDEFDEMTARVKAMESEIDRAIKALAKIGTVDITDRLSMDIIEVSNEIKGLQRSSDGLIAKEAQLRQELREGKISGDQFKTSIDAIRQSQDLLKDGAQQLQERLKGLFKETQTERQKAEVANLQQAYAVLDAKLKTLGTTHIDTANKVKILAEMMENLKAQSRLAGDASGELNAKLTTVNQQHKDTAKELGNLEKATQRYGMNIKNIIKWQLEWYLGAGLIWGAFFKIKNAITEFLDYSQGITDVGAITGATTEELKKMDVVVRDIATHSTMGFKAGADALKIMGQAGVSAADSLQVLPTVAMLTTATGASAADTIKLLTTAMNVWNIDAKDSTRIGNAFAAALNYSKLEIGDLAVAFNYLAPQAKLMGTSLEETLGIVAQMSQMGVKASTIGTGISGFMSRLIAPTDKFLKSLAKVGLSMKDLTDSNGRLLSFVEIIRKLEKAGMDVATVFEGLEQRQARSLATALTAGSSAFEYMTQAIGGTQAMQVMFSKSMDGTLNRMKALGNQVMDLAVSVGEFLTPIIQGSITVIGSLLTTLKDMSPLLIMVGIFQGLPVIIGLVTSAFSFLGVAIKALQGSVPLISFGPIWAAIAVGIGVLAALRYAFDDARKAKEQYDEGLRSSLAVQQNAIEVQKLTAIIKSHNTSLAEKTAAYEKLKPFLKEAGISYADNATAIAELSKQQSNGVTAINNFTDALIRQSLVMQLDSSKGMLDQYNKIQAKIDQAKKDTQTVAGMSQTGDVKLAMKQLEFKLDILNKEQAPAQAAIKAIEESMVGLSDANWAYVKSTGKVGEAMTREIEIARGLKKTEKTERVIPGTGKPEKTKSYQKAEEAADRKFFDSLLSIQERYNQESLAELDQQHELGLMSNKEYFDARIAEAVEGSNKELKILDLYQGQLKENYEKDFNKAKTTEKRNAVEDTYIAKLLENAKKREAIETKTNNILKGLWTKEVKDESALTAQELDHQLKMKEEALRQEMDIISASYKTQTDTNQWLYDHQEITAKQYFDKIRDLEEKETELKREELARRFYLFADNEAKKAELAGTSPEAQKAIYDRITEAYQKFEGDKVKITQDFADQNIATERKAADNIENIWAEKVAFGVIKRALEDLRKKWGQEWNDIYDLTTTIADNMEKSFEDIFFDAMTGKLKTMQDYWKSFTDTILRYISKILAQQAMIGLFGEQGGGGGLLGEILGSIIPGLGGGKSASGGTDLVDMFPNLSLTGKATGGLISGSGGPTEDKIPIMASNKEYIVNAQRTGKFKNFLDLINFGPEGIVNQLANILSTVSKGSFTVPNTANQLAFAGGGMIGTSGSGTNATHNYFYIQAVDPKSFSDLVEKNPGAIVKVTSDSIRRNGSLRNAMKGGM